MLTGSVTTLAATLDGVAQQVDSQREEVTLDQNGKHTLVDTSEANIHFNKGNQLDTSSIIPGMLLHLNGSYIDGGTFAADDIRIASTDPDRNVSPIGGDSGPSRPTRQNDVRPIVLRGTVRRVNNSTGTFVVQIANHFRTVYVTDTTNFVDINTGDNDQLPVHEGDRVTVKGQLESSGSVYADEISARRDVPGGQFPDGNITKITGQVSETSDKYSTRDISISTGPGHTIRVKVPRNISITRQSVHISVHELTTDDVITVAGNYSGSDLVAHSIVVDGTYR